MDRVGLSVFMWANLEMACGDLPAGPVVELFDRFIEWTHLAGSVVEEVLAEEGA